MRICFRYTRSKDDAADLLNRGFLKILNNLHLYQEEKTFEPWARTIMINTVLDELRARKVFMARMPASEIETIPGDMMPVNINDAETRLNQDDLIKMIHQLEEPGRQVFNLFVFEGLSHKEIAQALNVAEGTSRWYLAQARQSLQKMIAFEKRNLSSKAV